MTEAIRRYSEGEVKFTAGAALAAGEVIQLADGRPAVVAGVGAGIASGDEAAAFTNGVFDFASASAVVFAVGDDVYWDISGDTAIVSRGAPGDLLLGQAVKAKASGDVKVLTALNTGLSNVGAKGVLKVQELPITADFSNTEQDTGWALPAKALVLDVVVDVKTADASQTLDVGVAGNPDAFLDGISVNATGIIPGVFVKTTGSNNDLVGAAGTHTIGAFLTGLLIPGSDVAADGDGVAARGADGGSGGASIVFKGSDTTNTMRGSIWIIYAEL